MGAFLSLQEAKEHLNIDAEDTYDDGNINAMIDTAENTVMGYLNRTAEDVELEYGGDVPSPIIHAVKLHVGTLFANRESVTYGAANKVPHSYEFVLSQFRKY